MCSLRYLFHSFCYYSNILHDVEDYFGAIGPLKKCFVVTEKGTSLFHHSNYDLHSIGTGESRGLAFITL